MLRIAPVLLALVTCVAAAGTLQAETFVIHAGQDGREATVKIPVGAVFTFSADNAVALTNYMDPKVEAMRLSGDVRIQVTGAPTPIQIRADRIVLELTADEPAHLNGAIAHAGPHGHVQSAQVIVDDDQTQTFVGDVIFTEQTSSGALEIKADRLQRLTRPFAGV